MPNELDGLGDVRKINLVDIVTRTDFLSELYKAARMSRTKHKESGFAAYTNDGFSEISVNRAVLGRVEKDKVLHMIQHSMSSEFATSSKDKEGQGMRVPVDHYTLLFLHFHPGKDTLIPSGVDIAYLLYLRKFNETLLDSSETERTVYKSKKEPILIGYDIDYVNPAAIVCSVGKRQKDIDLIFIQGITKGAIDPDKFLQYAARYCNKLNGQRTRDLDGDLIAALGYFHRFKSRSQVLEFLNGSKYLRAVDVKIRDGKIKDSDLKKLRAFELVQTRFYKESDYRNDQSDSDDE